MPRIEVFSDFDGTISLGDTGCILIDSGMGEEARKEMDERIMRHELTFRDAMDIWWSSVNLTLEEGLELIRPVEIDPGFLQFYAFIQSHNIPFSMLSCGLDILIEQYMAWHMGEAEAKKMVVLANYAKVEGHKWIVTYRDDSPHSHDKSVSIKDSKQKFKQEIMDRQIEKEQAGETKEEREEEHVIVFCGDGVSDLSAAREADVLFARKDRGLESYCRTHKIPFLAFETFDEVTELIQGLQDGSLTMGEINRRQEEECQREA